MNQRAFTAKSNLGIQRVIQTPVKIHKANEQDSIQIIAIWDTGATGSVISKEVANKLGLIATGASLVSTANGQVIQKTYTIDIELPNHVVVRGIVATEVDGLSGGCHALIGMDIITLGDFSITNHNGSTCFSFRVPSSHEIDYVKSPNFGIVKITHADNVKKAARDQSLKNQAANKAKKKRR